MLRTGFIAVLTGIFLASAGMAYAHGTACCLPKQCPDGKIPVPGDAPEDAQCCTNPDDPENPDCSPVANAGWRCLRLNDDPAGMVAAIPGQQGTVGCIDGEAGTCAGGTIDGDGPSGCIGVGGARYVTSSSATSPNGGTIAQCTADSVDACCAKGACTSEPLPADDH